MRRIILVWYLYLRVWEIILLNYFFHVGYYDLQEVIVSDEELDLGAMDDNNSVF